MTISGAKPDDRERTEVCVSAHAAITYVVRELISKKGICQHKRQPEVSRVVIDGK